MSRKNKNYNIEHFLNENQQVKFWPAKRKKQLIILDYLKDKIEDNKIYTEKEINELLQKWHTFGDWVLLRRELIDLKYVARDAAGKSYTKITTSDIESEPEPSILEHMYSLFILF